MRQPTEQTDPTDPGTAGPHDRPDLAMACPRRVRLAGVLDAFSAPRVEEDLCQLASSRPHLVVDLTEVRVLTSGGLAMLQRCATHAAALGHRLQLRATEASLVARVLALGRVPHQVLPA